MTYQSVNPFNGELIKTFDEMTDAQLEIEARDRRDLLRDLAAQDLRRAGGDHRQGRRNCCTSKADEFARTMTLEMGKRIGEARGEVEFSSTDPRLLRQERRALPGAGEAQSDASAKRTWRAARSG